MIWTECDNVKAQSGLHLKVHSDMMNYLSLDVS